MLSAQPGAIRGRLYDVGPYPALARFDDEQTDAQDHLVFGEWLEISDVGLKAMDILEDYHGPGEVNEYERVWVCDVNGSREGWVYIWTDISGLKEISCGSWKAYREQKEFIAGTADITGKERNEK